MKWFILFTIYYEKWLFAYKWHQTSKVKWSITIHDLFALYILYEKQRRKGKSSPNQIHIARSYNNNIRTHVDVSQKKFLWKHQTPEHCNKKLLKKLNFTSKKITRETNFNFRFRRLPFLKGQILKMVAKFVNNFEKVQQILQEKS